MTVCGKVGRVASGHYYNWVLIAIEVEIISDICQHDIV